MKKLILNNLIIFFCLNIHGQTTQPSSRNSGMEWNHFENHKNINSNNYKKYLNLGDNSSLHTIKTKKYSQEKKHIRQQQFYKGIPVEGAILINHLSKEKTTLTNGHLIRGLSVNTKPSLNENKALNLALVYINADQYAWESSEMETLLKEIKKSQDATFFPKGKLTIISPDMKASSAKLAYQFEIYATSPLRRVKLFIDAHNGEILDEQSLMSHSCTAHHHGKISSNISCFGNTRYNGEQALSCSLSEDAYYLKNELWNIETRNGSFAPTNFDSPRKPIELNADNFMQSGSDLYLGEQDSVAIGVQWASEQWYDFFFGWAGSYDHINQFPIVNLVHVGHIDNAYWNGIWANYGDGVNGNTPWTSLDIVAHELSHGLIQFTAGLKYRGESGALNESFADIFALMVERHALGNDAFNWTIGEDVTNDSSGVRNMTDFMSYQGEGWYFGQGDNNGVHTNSGVQNHWFYLLSQEIGIENAAAICLHSLSNYLMPNSGYHDAKNASYWAAKDLFGENIADIVCAKWQEVGVFGTCNTENQITIIAPSTDITEKLTINQHCTIEWLHDRSINTVGIQYILSNQANWNNIVQDLPMGTLGEIQSFSWLVPELDTTQTIHIRVHDSNNFVIGSNSGGYQLEACSAVSNFLSEDYACLGDTLFLENISQGSDSQNWFIDGEILSNTFDSFWIPTSLGTHTISLQSFDDNVGCYHYFSKDIHISDHSDEVAAFEYQKDGINVSFTLSFPDTIVNVYSWDFGDGNTGSGLSVSHTYPEEGIYPVCLSVTNNCGSFSSCQHITFIESEGVLGSCEDEWEVFSSTHPSNTEITNDNIWSLLKDKNGDVWAGHFGGLIKIENGVPKVINTSNSGMPVDDITAIMEDSNNLKWIGTQNGLIISYDEEENIWTPHHYNDSVLPGKPVKQFIEDTNGNIWVTILGGGLVKYDGQSWHTYHSQNSDLPSDNVFGILEDQSGNIWVGTDGNGVAYMKDGVWQEFFTSSNSGLPDNRISHLVQDNNGHILIATLSGIALYDGENWVIFDSEDTGLTNDLIISLYKGNSGKIWAGTLNGGISVYDNGNWQYFNMTNSGIPSNIVTDFQEDDDGRIWMATWEGIAVLKFGSNSNFHAQISCAGESSFFENKSYFLDNSRWFVDGVEVSEEENLHYNFEESGTYEVILQVEDSENCTTTYKKWIDVPAAAWELSEYLPNAISDCGGLGSTINIDPQLYSFASYQWFYEGELIDTNAILSDITTEGLYHLSVIDSCGITATDSVHVFIGADSEDCVWPGDTNYDGIVNNKDLLPIGLAYDTYGHTRPNPTLDWIPEVASDWGIRYGNVDGKHIDTHGNGHINFWDIVAIVYNYGESRPTPSVQPSVHENDAPYTLTPVLESVDFDAKKIFISVDISSNQASPPPFYGLAFTLEYESYLPINPNMVALLPQVTFLENELYIRKDYPNRTEIAFVGTNHQNRSPYPNVAGGNTVVQYTIGIELEFPGNNNNLYLSVHPTNIVMLDNNGDRIPVNGQGINVFQPLYSSNIISQKIVNETDDSAPKSKHIATEHPTKIFPNPISEGQLYLDYYSNKPGILNIQFLDIYGRNILNINENIIKGENQIMMDVPKLKNGIYFIQLSKGEHLETIRLLVNSG